MRIIPRTTIKFGEWSWTSSLADDDSFAFVAAENKVALAKIVRNKKSKKPIEMKIIPGTEVKIKGWVWCSDISVDGRFVVFASDDDGLLRLADITRNAKTGEISGMKVQPKNAIKIGFSIYSCSISPSGDFVVFGTGGADKKIRLAAISENSKGGLHLQEIVDGGFSAGGEVYTCMIGQEEQYVILGSSNYKIQSAEIVRDPESGKAVTLALQASLDIGLQGQPYCMDFSRAHNLLIVGTEAELIRVFEILEDKSVKKITGFKERKDLSFDLEVPATTCDLSADESLLMFGSADGKISLARPVFDTETKNIKKFQVVPQSEIDFGVRPVGAFISSDNSFGLVATGNDATIQLVDLLLKTIRPKKKEKYKHGVQTLESGIQQKVLEKPSIEQYRQQQEMIAALQEVSQVLAGEVDLDGVLTDLSTILGKAIGAKWVNFWKLTPDKKGLFINAAYGMDKAYMEQTKVSPIPVGSAFIGRAVDTGKPWGASNCRTSPKVFSPLMKGVVRLNVYGLLCLPVASKNEVLGGMCIYYQTPHVFTQFELRLTTIAASQAATAIKNIGFIKELEAERNKTASMVNSLADGIIAYDLQDRIIAFNPRAEELLWVKRNQVLSKRPEELDIKNRSMLKNIQRISTLPLMEFEDEEILLVEPKRIYVRVRMLPVRTVGDKKIGSMRVIHDITEEKESEQLKTQFISIASHQLRTPLSGIKWIINLLLEGDYGQISEKGEKMFRQSAVVTDNLIQLVNDLLDVSRIEEERFDYKFEMHNVHELVKEIASGLAPQYKAAQVELTITKPSSPVPKIMIDQSKFRMAATNLFDNAAKYTLPGGKVVASLNIKKDSLILSVADTGIGVPKNQKKFLFTKFFRARNAVRLQTEGSGLGLWIVDQIVKRHNGRVHVETEENKGSTFSIQLPTKTLNMPL